MVSNPDGYRISNFFDKVLGAKVVNERMSWGAESKETRTIFLRVWDDQWDKAKGTVQVWWPVTKNPFGRRERREQLDMMEAGRPTFGVICIQHDGREGISRKIKDFDHQWFLRLAVPLTERADGVLLARVIEKVSLEDVLSTSGQEAALIDDIIELQKRRLTQTTRDALVKARLGQGQFRADVLTLWGGRCAVTGAATVEAIRASHILPWKKSTDDERLDASNGLPLVASLDALFDRYLITFQDNGVMMISKAIPAAERTLLGLANAKLRKTLPAETQAYLARHRVVFDTKEKKRMAG